MHTHTRARKGVLRLTFLPICSGGLRTMWWP